MFAARATRVGDPCHDQTINRRDLESATPCDAGEFSAQRHRAGAIEREERLEFLQVTANRSQFVTGRIGGPGRLWRRAVEGKSVGEDAPGRGFGHPAGVDIQFVRRRGDLALGCELDDDDAGEGETAQGAFASGTENAVVIAHGEQPRGTVGPLKLRRLQQHEKLASPFAGGVAHRPLGRVNHGHRGSLRDHDRGRDHETAGQQSEKSGPKHTGVEHGACPGRSLRPG